MGAVTAGTTVAATLFTVGKYVFNQAVTWAGKAVDVYGPQKGVGVIQNIVSDKIGFGPIGKGIGLVAGYFVAGETKELLNRDKVDIGLGGIVAIGTKFVTNETKKPEPEIELHMLDKENKAAFGLLKFANEKLKK